jgi:hypothetical protein
MQSRIPMSEPDKGAQPSQVLKEIYRLHKDGRRFTSSSWYKAE